MGGTGRDSSGDPDNCLLLHPRCHERVESNRASAYLAGWLVAQVDDPAVIPARLWDGWFLLNPNGTMLRVSAGRVEGEAPDPAEIKNV